jgi:hypothetical protein
MCVAHSKFKFFTNKIFCLTSIISATRRSCSVKTGRDEHHILVDLYGNFGRERGGGLRDNEFHQLNYCPDWYSSSR